MLIVLKMAFCKKGKYKECNKKNRYLRDRLKNNGSTQKRKATELQTDHATSWNISWFDTEDQELSESIKIVSNWDMCPCANSGAEERGVCDVIAEEIHQPSKQ